MEEIEGAVLFLSDALCNFNTYFLFTTLAEDFLEKHVGL